MSTFSEYVFGALFIVGLLSFGYWFFFASSWVGFYYPNKGDLTRHIHSQKLGSLQECQEWVSSQARIFDPYSKGFDYECGRDCKLISGSNVYMCQETVN